jgi:hypothetical protein
MPEKAKSNISFINSFMMKPTYFFMNQTGTIYTILLGLHTILLGLKTRFTHQKEILNTSNTQNINIKTS